MSELTSMMNIGKEMAAKLTSVGIESFEKLIEVGAKDAFFKLKQKYPNVCLVHLYTLEGAIHDIEFNRLSEDTKKELKEFSDFLKKIVTMIPVCKRNIFFPLVMWQFAVLSGLPYFYGEISNM